MMNNILEQIDNLLRRTDNSKSLDFIARSIKILEQILLIISIQTNKLIMPISGRYILFKDSNRSSLKEFTRMKILFFSWSLPRVMINILGYATQKCQNSVLFRRVRLVSTFPLLEILGIFCSNLLYASALFFQKDKGELTFMFVCMSVPDTQVIGHFIFWFKILLRLLLL